MAVILSEKFDRALQYASFIHAGQQRKRAEVPFLAHLMGVASIALEYGADEEEAMGALLHEAVEAAGGKGRLEDIRLRFGEDVAAIVEGCTDAKVSPKPPWRTRKAAVIAGLPHASSSVRLVSAADKLYNARAALKDLRLKGNVAWQSFKGGKEGTLWYYRCLVQAYKSAGTSSLVEELDRTVLELERLAKELEAEEAIAPSQSK